MRKPKVQNKYNLKPKDICRAVILDEKRIHQKPFWRNNVVSAWCLSEGVGEGYFGDSIDSYWIGFYDKDAKSYAGKYVLIVMLTKIWHHILSKSFSILRKSRMNGIFSCRKNY